MTTVQVFTAEKMQEVKDATIVTATLDGNTLVLTRSDAAEIQVDLSSLSGGGGGGDTLPTVGFATDHGDITNDITIVDVDAALHDIINLTLPDSPAGTKFTVMVFGSWSPGAFDDKGAYIAGDTMDLPINDGGGLMLYTQNFGGNTWAPTSSDTFISDGAAWHVLSQTYPEAGNIPRDPSYDVGAGLSSANVGGALVELHGLILDKPLAELSDVDLTGITDLQILVWDDATSKFIPADQPSGGGGSGIVGFKKAVRLGVLTNLVVSGTTWAVIDATYLPDLTIPASVGDVIEASVSWFWLNGGNNGNVNVCTVVAGTPVNYFTTNPGGLLSWYGQSDYFSVVGGPEYYTVVEGDLVDGTVTLRLVGRAGDGAGGSKTILSDTGRARQSFAVKNIGPATP